MIILPPSVSGGEDCIKVNDEMSIQHNTPVLNLVEELFLLSLHDRKGTVAFLAVEPMPFGLAGAMLADLVMQGKLAVDGKKGKLLVMDPGPCGDELLDDALAKIADAEGPWSARYWVQNFSLHGKKFQKRLAARLVEKGVLLQVHKRYLWVVRHTVYPQLDASAKYWLKEQLRGAVLGGQVPDARTLTLLSLVKDCRMLNLIFTRDERKAARKRIAALWEGEWAVEPVEKALKEIDLAVQAAIASAGGAV